MGWRNSSDIWTTDLQTNAKYLFDWLAQQLFVSSIFVDLDVWLTSARQRITSQHCVAVCRHEYFGLSTFVSQWYLSSLFLILEWRHIHWSRSPNWRKMDDFGWNRMILFNVAVQISKYIHGHMNFIVLLHLAHWSQLGSIHITWLGERLHLQVCPILSCYYPG
jgi:hypothetical protein